MTAYLISYTYCRNNEWKFDNHIYYAEKITEIEFYQLINELANIEHVEPYEHKIAILNWKKFEEE